MCVLVRVFVYLRGCTCLNLFAELVIVCLCSCVGVLACTCVLSLCAVTLECDKAGKDPAGCRRVRLGIGKSVSLMQASICCQAILRILNGKGMETVRHSVLV